MGLFTGWRWNFPRIRMDDYDSEDQTRHIWQEVAEANAEEDSGFRAMAIAEWMDALHAIETKLRYETTWAERRRWKRFVVRKNRERGYYRG